MRVGHYAQDKFYTIERPEGTIRVIPSVGVDRPGQRSRWLIQRKRSRGSLPSPPDGL
jgi:hypothetical protein